MRVSEGSENMMSSWTKEWPAAVTVCDEKGIILEMNDRADSVFSGSGGRGLIGSNVLDCHPEPARSKLEGLMAGQATNVYTIQKDGRRKLIHQAPWYRDGRYAGYVEISLEIPREMPHFNRDSEPTS